MRVPCQAVAAGGQQILNLFSTLEAEINPQATFTTGYCPEPQRDSRIFSGMTMVSRMEAELGPRRLCHPKDVCLPHPPIPQRFCPQFAQPLSNLRSSQQSFSQVWRNSAKCTSWRTLSVPVCILELTTWSAPGHTLFLRCYARHQL